MLQIASFLKHVQYAMHCVLENASVFSSWDIRYQNILDDRKGHFYSFHLDLNLQPKRHLSHPVQKGKSLSTTTGLSVHLPPC